jgi:glucose-6-phosphate isomerase
VNTTPPTGCASWPQLEALARAGAKIHLRDRFAMDPARGGRLQFEGAGVRLDLSLQRLDDAVLAALQRLASERGLEAWREALFAGERINSTENRAAWHTALRAGERAPSEVRATLERTCRIAARLRAGAWLGASGQPIERIVHLGTGGSDLGPRLACQALGQLNSNSPAIRFASNVDPDDLDRALAGAMPDRTLFVVVSKTFSTQETMANASAARRWLANAMPAGTDLSAHFIAITENLASAARFGVAETLPLWPWVGGRFSVWSAVGLALACAIGESGFRTLLSGAHEMDDHFLHAESERNLPILLALTGIWNTNFLGCATHAVLPYATRLGLLPAYLQQLEMESNGKRVDREGREVEYATAPVVWGAEGTAGQHSFHQLLHQGTQIVPADFIVVRDGPGDAEMRRILGAHATAQARALAFGLDDPSLPAWRQHPGNRPSCRLELDMLDARNLGRLLALYEHKVFVQGVIWNLNSFDQWGVELGKSLAAGILARPPGA